MIVSGNTLKKYRLRHNLFINEIIFIDALDLKNLVRPDARVVLEHESGLNLA